MRITPRIRSPRTQAAATGGQARACTAALPYTSSHTAARRRTGSSQSVAIASSSMRAVREICTRRNVLMICDEVQTGLGRTGRFFAVEHWGVEPDMVLMDVSMPGTNGIELIKHMLAERPALIILMLSMHDESLYALRALRAGARGYVMKQQTMENILDALQKVSSGGIYVSPNFSDKLIFKTIAGSTDECGSPLEKLSDRQLEVLQLFGRSKTTREISETLNLSVKTIETHRAHIKEKLGFKDAEELMDFAIEWMTSQEG